MYRDKEREIGRERENERAIFGILLGSHIFYTSFIITTTHLAIERGRDILQYKEGGRERDRERKGYTTHMAIEGGRYRERKGYTTIHTWH